MGTLRGAGWVPIGVAGAISRRKFLKRGLTIGTLALVGDAFGLEPEWIDVQKVEIPIKGLGQAFNGYRISLFSDIHWPRRIDHGYMRRVVAKSNAFDPDLVAIPGDICDGKGILPSHIPNLSGIFNGLKSRDGVVSTLGNHDHAFQVDKLRRMIAEHTPLEDIENRHQIIERKGDVIAVGGVPDLYFGRPDPVQTFAGLPEDIPRILLSHNPDVAEDHVWNTRIDLQLSGHTHGGEICLPFGFAPKIPSKYGQKFREGLVQGRSHRVYVTRGVCSPRHVRLFCRPEVTHITLRCA